MPRPADEHKRLILDQFTRQAAPFAERHALSGEEANRLLIDLARVGPMDEVLDVACGPGIVACALAVVARHVTGIDLTPAMIAQAEAKQQALGLANLTWVVGDAVPLPFADRSFSVVVSRYSYHHLLDPKAAFAEMVRVAQPGGRVAVIDVYTTSPEQAQAYDRVERWRDPSHVRALSMAELNGLFREAGLCDVRTAFYGVPVTLEGVLGASFPNPCDADKVREAFANDIGVNALGVGATRRDGDIHFTFPTVIVAGAMADASRVVP
jgi:SAM-dependent methyltransferase